MHDIIEYVIDEKFRTITIPSNGLILGVVGDKEINQIRFTIPKYCSGFDLSDFTARVNYVNPNGDGNYWETAVQEYDEDHLSFVWLLEQIVTRYVGDVKISVKLFKRENGQILKQFNTRSATGKVYDGFDVSSTLTPEEQESLLDKVSNDIDLFKNEVEQDLEEMRTQLSNHIDTENTAIDQLKGDIVELNNITKKNISIVETLDTTAFRYNIHILKGSLVRITNKGNGNITLNYGNSSNEYHVTNALKPNGVIEFIVEENATYVRSYVPDKSVNIDITIKNNLVRKFEDIKDYSTEKLLDLSNFICGGSDISYYPANGRVNNFLNPIKVLPNEKYIIKALDYAPYKGIRVGIIFRKSDMTILKDSGWVQIYKDSYCFETTEETEYITMTISFSETSETVTTGTTEATTNINLDVLRKMKIDMQKGPVYIKRTVRGIDEWGYATDVHRPIVNDSLFRIVAHRGYNDEAPENTLSAFRLAKSKGFNWIETDISLTSDGIPVLLHDETIDRTSNGTGNIKDMTFEQVRSYDFGSWKNVKYKGEKIPTLEEALTLCKRIGLSMYLELKATATYNTSIIISLFELVNKCGMLDNVVWVSGKIDYMHMCKNIANNVIARKTKIGFIVNSVDDSVIEAYKNYMVSDYTEPCLSINKTGVNDEVINKLVSENIPLDIWCLDTVDEIINVNPYVTGITTNSVHVWEVLYNALT